LRNEVLEVRNAKLRALSERVARDVPHRRDPERFHIEKSCICQHLEHLASMIEERSERSLTINRTRRSVAPQRQYR
jgi:hypothetical protein